MILGPMSHSSFVCQMLSLNWFLFVPFLITPQPSIRWGIPFMPINILGMIGVAPPAGGATVHVIGGGIDRDYVRRFAQVHETAGFDSVLVGYSSSSAEGFQSCPIRRSAYGPSEVSGSPSSWFCDPNARGTDSGNI